MGWGKNLVHSFVLYAFLPSSQENTISHAWNISKAWERRTCQQQEVKSNLYQLLVNVLEQNIHGSSFVLYHNEAYRVLYLLEYRKYVDETVCLVAKRTVSHKYLGTGRNPICSIIKVDVGRANLRLK